MKPMGNTMLRATVEEDLRLCAVDGCVYAADYRAPRSREALRDYIWLCLDHVRAYNTAWNYYAGMNEAEIEAHRRADITWRRPTWPLGAREANGRTRKRDPFGILGPGDEPEIEPGEHLVTAEPAERRALATLGLKPPVSAEIVKARYKELVKELHPDVNGADNRAEERLKSVNQAYNTLRVSRTH